MKRATIVIIILAVIICTGCSQAESNGDNSFTPGIDNVGDEPQNNSIEERTVFFDSAMSTDNGMLPLDSESLIPEVLSYVDPAFEGTKRDFAMSGTLYSYVYEKSYYVDTLPVPYQQYVLKEDGKRVGWIQAVDEYPEFIHWYTSDREGFKGDFTEESLTFALSAISEKYGQDVSQFAKYFDNDSGKSVVVYKIVDGVSYKVGACGVCDTEDGFKICHLLVFPKSLQDKFHLKYTVEEIKEMVESGLAEQYPGARVDSLSIGDGTTSSQYTYLIAKKTWAYSFFANVTVLNEDGEEITASVGCYIPFELDE